MNSSSRSSCRRKDLRRTIPISRSATGFPMLSHWCRSRLGLRSTETISRTRVSRSAALRTSHGGMREAEAALRGKAANEAAFAQAADLVLREAKGFGHNTFKIELARRTIVRALSQAARGTPQVQSNKKIA